MATLASAPACLSSGTVGCKLARVAMWGKMVIDMQNPDTWQAGRELDAEIARVMGWEVKRYTNGDLMTNIGGIRCYIPHYSTSWEGMGLMLEWLNKFSNTELRHSFGEGAEWTVLFTLHEPSLHWERLYFNGFADTAPLAVARAILAYAAQSEGVR